MTARQRQREHCGNENVFSRTPRDKVQKWQLGRGTWLPGFQFQTVRQVLQVTRKVSPAVLRIHLLSLCATLTGWLAATQHGASPLLGWVLLCHLWGTCDKIIAILINLLYCCIFPLPSLYKQALLVRLSVFSCLRNSCRTESRSCLKLIDLLFGKKPWLIYEMMQTPWGRRGAEAGELWRTRKEKEVCSESRVRKQLWLQEQSPSEPWLRARSQGIQGLELWVSNLNKDPWALKYDSETLKSPKWMRSDPPKCGLSADEWDASTLLSN